LGYAGLSLSLPQRVRAPAWRAVRQRAYQLAEGALHARGRCGAFPRGRLATLSSSFETNASASDTRVGTSLSLSLARLYDQARGGQQGIVFENARQRNIETLQTQSNGVPAIALRARCSFTLADRHRKHVLGTQDWSFCDRHSRDIR